jgi:hypothetical protein
MVFAKAAGELKWNQTSSYTRLRQYFSVTCNLMRSLVGISLFVIGIFINSCESKFNENSVRARSLSLANHLDSTSFSEIKDYEYIQRGKHGAWLRKLGDSNLYAFEFLVDHDTDKLTVYRPMGFVMDFKSNYTFDIKVSQVLFAKINDTIFRITVTDTLGRDHVFDTSVSVSKIFPNKNPYKIFASLDAFKNRFGLISYSNYSTTSDLFVFWIDQEFKLTYMEDTEMTNLNSNKFWIDEFNKGQKIKDHWRLSKVY